MIFVVLGTWEMPFTRPLIEIEQAAKNGLLPEPIVVQSGKTAYSSTCMRLVPFFGPAEIESMYEQASLVICQAGVGSIMLGLRKRKKVVAIARRHKFDEHIDDHQLEILEAFSKMGAILTWKGEGDLSDVLGKTKDFVGTDYVFGQEKISAAILNYLGAKVRRN
jgi:UDP-N-acetylglucosamine transferase subunit ALG13